MTTHSLSSVCHKFSKLLLASLLAFGFGLGSAQAHLSKTQAKNAANAIMHSNDHAKAAFDVAQAVTKGTDPAEAAANAALIVKYLPSKAQRLYAGLVGWGVADNFPNQVASITLKLIRLNSNLKGSAALVIYQMASKADFGQAQQIAVGLSIVLSQSEKVASNTLKITNNLMQAVLTSNFNVVGMTDQQKASNLAFIAANLSVGVIGDSKKLSSNQEKELKAITLALSSRVAAIANNNPSSATVIYQSVANYALELQQTLKANGVSSKTINNVMVQSSTLLQQQFRSEAAVIQQAFQDGIAQNTTKIQDIGEIGKKETPFVDGTAK